MSSSSFINSNANSKVTLIGVVNKTASSLPEALTFVSCLPLEDLQQDHYFYYVYQLSSPHKLQHHFLLSFHLFLED